MWLAGGARNNPSRRLSVCPPSESRWGIQYQRECISELEGQTIQTRDCHCEIGKLHDFTYLKYNHFVYYILIAIPLIATSGPFASPRPCRWQPFVLGVHFQKTWLPPRWTPGESRSFSAMDATRLEGTKTFGRVQFGGSLGYKTISIELERCWHNCKIFYQLGRSSTLTFQPC